MIGPISRIVLRYLAGALVAYGIVSPEAGAELAVDPDLLLVIGGILAAGAEAAYAFAKKSGGKT